MWPGSVPSPVHRELVLETPPHSLEEPLHPCGMKVSLADTVELSTLGWGILMLGPQLLLCPSPTRLSQGLEWVWEPDGFARGMATVPG